MTYLNLGILAHVDAGKTTLTERLLYDAGVIDTVGSVDSGDTQTDSMDIERRRGITIRAAVVSFPIADLTVNLVDTPGHSDFIGEVERVIRVLDGAVLVVSAVEGVQSQTRILMRTLTKLGVPTLIFVNKIDRPGARYDELLADIRAKLTPRAVAMTTVENIGTRSAQASPLNITGPGSIDSTAELLADGDETFLARFIDDDISPQTCLAELARQSRDGRIHPVFFGSAATGGGVDAVAAGISRYLPTAAHHGDGEPSGSVFKVDRTPTGQKIAYLRMWSGTLHPRSRVVIHRSAPGGTLTVEGKTTGIGVFDRGTATRSGPVTAGGIATVHGLRDIAIGDALGNPRDTAGFPLFAQPTLETVVRTVDPGNRMRLLPALRSLAERDPLVNPHYDAASGDISVKLYGEVQKEVIASLLAEEFDIQVEFDTTQTIHVERPIGVGNAVEELGRWASTHFIATVGLRLEPMEPGTGVSYGIEVERGSLLHAFHTAIEETVRAELLRGRYGWEVIDCRVLLTHSGYAPPTTPADFRGLTAVLMERLLHRAGTQVCEPINRFELEFAEELATAVLPSLTASGAAITGHTVVNRTARLVGTMPAAAVYGFEQTLPALTVGGAVFTTELDGYRTVSRLPPPTRGQRARTDSSVA